MHNSPQYVETAVPQVMCHMYSNPRYMKISVPQVMRHMYNNPDEVAAKGRASRERMHSMYSPGAVARVAGALQQPFGTPNHFHNI